MVVLKKIKGSTLMETMVATVLLVIIFTFASQVMQSLLAGTQRVNTLAAREHLNGLEYTFQNGRLALPYAEQWGDWEIRFEVVEHEGRTQTHVSAVNPIVDQEITYTIPVQNAP